MKDKITIDLTFHNCATCPPKEDFHPNLCVTNGSAVFNVSYDDGEWYDPEFNEYIPQGMLHEFWWTDVVNNVSNEKLNNKEE